MSTVADAATHPVEPLSQFAQKAEVLRRKLAMMRRSGRFQKNTDWIMVRTEANPAINCSDMVKWLVKLWGADPSPKLQEKEQPWT